jgi:hypothetical protein
MVKPFQARQVRNKQGIVLFIVLGTIFIVIILGNIILSIILSQSRLTHHQISRIQAYYAAQAGINYALEMLRITPTKGGWSVGINCMPASPCTHAFSTGDFKPASIIGNSVSIIIRSPQSVNPGAPCFNPPGNSACVYASVDYTHTP